jgi:hypothetical protein
MYIQKVIRKKTQDKNNFLLTPRRLFTKITGSGSISQLWIRGSGSVPKFFLGSATLAGAIRNLLKYRRRALPKFESAAALLRFFASERKRAHL